MSNHANSLQALPQQVQSEKTKGVSPVRSLPEVYCVYHFAVDTEGTCGVGGGPQLREK